jgi:hypothetical protein
VTGRDRLVVIVIAAALVLGGFWFFALAPKRKQATDLQGQVAKQELRLAAARGQAVAAEQAKNRYDADYAAVAALGQAVPADDDVPSLIVQVDRAAEREGVSFRSLALDASGSASQPSAPAPAPAPAPAAPAQGTEKDSASDSGAAPSAPAAPASPAPATQAAATTLPPGASVGTAGFPTMPFTFEFTGSFFRLEDFLHRVNGFTTVRDGGDLLVRGRLLSVDSFDLKAAPSGFPKIAASVHATAYVLPPGQGLTAGATAKGPAGATPATEGGTPADSGSSSAPVAPTAAIGITGGRR